MSKHTITESESKALRHEHERQRSFKVGTNEAMTNALAAVGSRGGGRFE